MSGGKDAFEERLKRLGSEKPATAAQKPRVLDVPKEPRIDLNPEPIRQGTSPMLAFVACLVLLLGGGAFATMALMPHLIFQAFPVEGTTIELIPEVEEAPKGNVEVQLESMGILDRVLAFVDGFGEKPMTGPLAYLPDAPQGWVRVTESDVQQPGYLETLMTSWIQTGVPLDQNAGFQRLSHFADTYSSPDTEMKVLARSRTTAFYLNPQGEFLVVRLEFLSDRGALGEPTNASGWIESLYQRETKDLKDDEILERNELAGLPVTNRVVPHGSSLVSRPIGDKYDIPNGMKLAVPLTHRAVMKIEGLSTPTAAEALIKNVDRFALNDLLAS